MGKLEIAPLFTPRSLDLCLYTILADTFELKRTEGYDLLFSSRSHVADAKVFNKLKQMKDFYEGLKRGNHSPIFWDGERTHFNYKISFYYKLGFEEVPFTKKKFKRGEVFDSRWLLNNFTVYESNLIIKEYNSIKDSLSKA